MARKAVQVRDLHNQTGMPEPRPVLLCKKCGGTFSANGGDYFLKTFDTVLKHCGQNLHLVIPRTVYEEVM